MSERRQQHGGVAVAVAVGFGRRQQAFDLVTGQVLADPAARHSGGAAEQLSVFRWLEAPA
jgi:hypothetical protein